MSRLYAVAMDMKSSRQEAREAIEQYRKKAYAHPGGLLIGERFNHRGWPPDVVIAFMSAPVIKPAAGEIFKKLYSK